LTGAADAKLSRGALVALVVGSMVGAGIFTLPAAFGRTTGALGAIIAWGIAGTGMLMLALVFQNLFIRAESFVFTVFCVAALAALFALWSGTIAI
jgi:arginine:ornithine antiporter/lysine permease